jgi:hypothetical protein
MKSSLIRQYVGLCLLPASGWFLQDLLFDPEDGGKMLLQNVGPEARTLHNHRCENFRTSLG